MTPDNIDGRPDRRLVRRRIAVLNLVLLATAGGVAAWTMQARSDDGHRLIYEETLPGGRVFRCFSDGAFIGSAGTVVTDADAPAAPEGAEQGPAIVVRPPDLTEEEARQARDEYATSGRTPEQDQADFERLSAECRERR